MEDDGVNTNNKRECTEREQTYYLKIHKKWAHHTPEEDGNSVTEPTRELERLQKLLETKNAMTDELYDWVQQRVNIYNNL